MAGWTSGIDLSLPGDYSSTYDPTQGYSYTGTYNMYPSYTPQGLISGGNTNYNGYAGAAGAVVGSYDNASTDTGSSVLGGAASGAAAGTAIMPGIGTVIGGVVGAIAGYFGSKSKKKQQQKQFEQQKELAVAQIQEQEKNYQLHQQQTKDAFANYKPYASQGYQFKNGLLSGGNPQPMQSAAPQGNPQPPPGQGQAPTNDPNALAQFYQQQAQQQQAQAMSQYGGLLHG